MTDVTAPKTMVAGARNRTAIRLRKRHAAETRFRLYGLAAILAAGGMLGLLLITIALNGYQAFVQTEIALDVHFKAEYIDPKGSNDPDVWRKADFQGLLKSALRDAFPKVKKRREKRQLYSLVSSGAGVDLRDQVLKNPDLIGETKRLWITASDEIDGLVKGHYSATAKRKTTGSSLSRSTGSRFWKSKALYAAASTPPSSPVAIPASPNRRASGVR